MTARSVDTASAPSAQSPAMEPGHNGGGLLRRGNPRNRGNLGVQRVKVREAFVTAVYGRIRRLKEIVEGKDVEQWLLDGKGNVVRVMAPAPIRDQLRALDLMARYGLGTEVKLEGGAEPLEINVIHRFAGPNERGGIDEPPIRVVQRQLPGAGA